MMNREKHFRNRIVTALIVAALLLVQSVPAFAVDSTATATGAFSPPLSNGWEGTDTTTAQSRTEGLSVPSVTASTLEELLQAIEQAKDGTVIGIGCEIVCPEGAIIGNTRNITLLRTGPDGQIRTASPGKDSPVNIQGITFDGGSVSTTKPFIEVNIPTNLKDCTFTNCTAGAVAIAAESAIFDYCTFSNNTGEEGAHLRIGGNSSTVNNCTFTGGSAELRGGAICNLTTQKTVLTGCTITWNTAGEHAGGIWNGGALDISQCKIYGNTANGETEDIVNTSWGLLGLLDSYDDLVELYAPDELIPNRWAVDTFTQALDPSPYTVYSMTFAEPEPEPEPTPEPTPEPEPEPSPDPDPEPEQDTPSNSTTATDNSTTDNSNREDNSQYTSTVDSNNTSTVNNFYPQGPDIGASDGQQEVQTIVVPAGSTGEPFQQTIQIGGDQPEGTASEGSGDMNITVNVAPLEETDPAVEAVDQQAGFSLYQVCVICLLFGILVFLMVAWISRKKDR